MNGEAIKAKKSFILIALFSMLFTLFQPFVSEIVYARTNEGNGSVSVLKIDEDSDEGLEGVELSIETEHGNKVDNKTTDEKGMATFDGLPNGKYNIKELNTADGYLLDENIYEVVVEKDKTTDLIISSEKENVEEETKDEIVEEETKDVSVEEETKDVSVEEETKDVSVEVNESMDKKEISAQQKQNFLLPKPISMPMSISKSRPSDYPTNPESSLNHNKAEVATDDSYASSDYSVVAKYGKNTKFIPNNTGTIMRQQNRPNKYFWVDGWGLEQNVGGTYTNIGHYNGRSLDLRFTFNNYVKTRTDWIKERQYVMMYSDEIAFSTGGFDNVDVKMEYLYSDTGEPATDMKGSYMTISDLDFRQAVGFTDNQMSKINKMYFDKNTNVDTWKYNKKTYFGDAEGVSVNASNEQHLFTALVDGHTLEFDWNVGRWLPSGTLPKNAVLFGTDASQPNGFIILDKTNAGLSGIQIEHYFVYQAEKPVRTETLVPTKRVSDNDEHRIFENTLGKINETFTYDIFHSVPAEYKRFYYNTYRVEDDIPKELNIHSKKVYDGDGNDVTNKFTISETNNQVRFDAKSAELKKNNFYEHTYRFEIKVSIKDDADLSKYGTGTNIKIPNKANAIVDGKGKATNVVHTKIPEPITPIITKNVEGKKHIEVAHGKEYNYNIDVKMPTSIAGYDTLRITDRLDNRLNVKKAELIVSGDSQLSNQLSEKIKINNEANRVDLELNRSEIAKVRDKQLNLKITSSIKEGTAVDLIGNVASIQVNNQTEQKTEEVTVRPMIDIKVVKKWDDTHPERRPNELTYELSRKIASGSYKIVATETATKANNYSHTFKDYPKFDDSNREYTYKVVEKRTDNLYEYNISEGKDIGDNTFEITNSQRHGEIKVVKKEGNQNPKFEENFNGGSTIKGTVEMAGAKYVLAERSSGMTIDEITLDENGEGYFKKVPLGEYTIQEVVAPKGYQLDETKYNVSIKTVGDNAHYNFTMYNPKLKNVSAQKVWDGTKLDEVTIELLADGEPIDSIVLNDDNNWKHTFEQLPAIDNFNDRNEIDYTVEEIEWLDGYRVSIDGNETDGYVITNREVGKIVLPDTGGLGALAVVAVIGGLVFIGRRKSKKEKEE